MSPDANNHFGNGVLEMQTFFPFNSATLAESDHRAVPEEPEYGTVPDTSRFVAMDGQMSPAEYPIDAANFAATAEPKNTTTWLLVGVCGSGMQSLCELLLSNPNIHVVGTDLDDATLQTVRQRFAGRLTSVPWNLTSHSSKLHVDRAVYSLAVPPSSSPMEWIKQHKIPQQSLPEALRELLGTRRQLCVAGTHGKSTTTAMISWILRQTGIPSPTFVGGELQRAANSVRSSPDGDAISAPAVIESCEYRNTFLSYWPDIAVLNSVEADHFDWFKTDDERISAFLTFAQRVPKNGFLVINGDDKLAGHLSTQVSCRVLQYATCSESNTAGRTPGDAWLVDELGQPVLLPVESAAETPIRFRQTFHLRRVTSSGGESLNAPIWVTLGQPGLHNCQNAAAAILAASALGIRPEVSAEALRTFPGIRRRFEYRGNWRGVHWIDDYAHHPSAVRTTLQTARQVFHGRRLIAVFEPHQMSRTTELFADFCDSLGLADEILVLPVLPARENVTPAQCLRKSGQLVRTVNHDRIRAFLMTNLDQVQGRLDYSVRPGDVVITMGAGRTHQIHDEIHRRLQRDFAA